MDVVTGLQEFGCQVDIFDPWANPEEVKKEYGLNSVQSISDLKNSNYDAIVLATAHREFTGMDLTDFYDGSGVIYDT